MKKLTRIERIEIKMKKKIFPPTDSDDVSWLPLRNFLTIVEDCSEKFHTIIQKFKYLALSSLFYLNI